MLRARTAGLAVAAVAVLGGCQRPPGPARASHAREIMGTLAEVTAVAADRMTADAAVAAGYARLEDVNRLMSDYVADSEVGRLNSLPAGTPIAVSPETLHCLQRALEICRASGGTFDATCRPLVRLWKQAAAEGRLPSADELRQARALVGPDRIAIDAERRCVWRVADGVQVDLGGIAKGYALDLAAEAMRGAGASGALVNVGGDVRAVGRDADGRPWQVGVKHPFQDGLFAVLSLTDRAVATSGVQQRFYEIGGRRYSHIIDPRSGWPAEQSPSVTVIAADGLTADAWATAFSVLSVEEGRGLIEAGGAPGVEVLWISGSAEEPVADMTPGFAGYLAE